MVAWSLLQTVESCRYQMAWVPMSLVECNNMLFLYYIKTILFLLEGHFAFNDTLHEVCNGIYVYFLCPWETPMCIIGERERSNL